MEKLLDKKNQKAQTAVIGDVTLKMSLPDSTSPEWIGQTEAGFIHLRPTGHQDQNVRRCEMRI